jgi:hypothetical protein
MLVLNSAPVRIAPRDPTRAWAVSGVTVPIPQGWAGTHTLKLVPRRTYQLHLHNSTVSLQPVGIHRTEVRNPPSSVFSERGGHSVLLMALSNEKVDEAPGSSTIM